MSVLFFATTILVGEVTIKGRVEHTKSLEQCTWNCTLDFALVMLILRKILNLSGQNFNLKE